MSDTPLGDHALLSDRHGLALVDRSGAVVWWCPARPDSPAVFAALLDDAAGSWTVRACGATRSTRRYLDSTLVLETTVHTAAGTLVVTDALLVGDGDREHDLGVDSPQVLVRRLHCPDGLVEVEVMFAPRPEFGVVHPQLSAVDGGLLARGGADQLVLTCPIPLDVDGSDARGRLRLQAGDTVHLALHHGRLGSSAARTWDSAELAARLEDTVAAWQSWSGLHQTYNGPYAEQVHLSGRVLQALSFAPTGAIVAAATAGLPEEVGGERNWDYRYTWVRDAALTLQALWVAACPHEAADFFTFLAGAAAGALGAGRPLPVMLGVGGERDLTPRPLEHLAGWRGSRPVTIGNGAWTQSQIDVYGELLGAAHRLREQLAGLPAPTRAFLVACADAAAACWRDTDQGLWESRGEPQHHVYSKVMCWVALDRAIDLADLLHAVDRVPAWQAEADRIHQTVLDDGWDEHVGAFTQAFGSQALDASVLVLPIVGFLPADDPRIVATVQAVAEQLTDARGLVHRYQTRGGGDGLAGDEGSFLLCTFWLAEAQALAGDTDAAEATLRAGLAAANDLGLLSEEVDTATGEQLGNLPQAFSHVGLVNAAYALQQALERDEPVPTRPPQLAERAAVPGAVPRPTPERGRRRSGSVDVVLPCLDEAEALPGVLARVPAGWRAIVVDNGSTDQTAAVARRHGAVVVSEPRHGFGAAARAGLLAATADVVCFLDADGSLDPAQLPRVAGPVLAGTADLVLGARRPAAGAWPPHARLANRLLARELRRRGLPLTDLGPMRAARRTALLELGVQDLRSGWPLEMVLRAGRAGWRLEEVDVDYLPRAGGRSKVTGTWRGTAVAVRDMRRLLADVELRVGAGQAPW